MTREEIENMPAGREIDALIAERIFGAVDVSLYMDIWTHGEKGKRQVVKHYSTRIADVWEVLEKINLTDFFIEKAGSHYCVNLTVESACAETVPLAICRAALLGWRLENEG